MEHQVFAELLGNYGEFCGSIAVFATLGYLAIQVRQNTKAEKQSALDVSIRNLMSVRQSLFENSEMTGISFRGLNAPDSLSEEEWYRFRIWFANVLMSLWHIYEQPPSLRQELWETQKAVLGRIITSPGGRVYWSQHSDEFVSSFREEVERVLEQNPDQRAFR